MPLVVVSFGRCWRNGVLGSIHLQSQAGFWFGSDLVTSREMFQYAAGYFVRDVVFILVWFTYTLMSVVIGEGFSSSLFTTSFDLYVCMFLHNYSAG